MVRREANQHRADGSSRFSTAACRTGFASTRPSCTGCIGLTSSVDFLSQWDLEHVGEPSARSARAYDLIVFAGHHEYVTTREYDLVEGYRDLGGNLMFLSANNYYWRGRATRRHVIEKSQRWRDLGRPESALVGVQYIGLPGDPRGVHGLCDDAGSTMAARRGRS